ncbi:MAG: D-2-hydroxyacid dehydrogenase [Chloroflexi bacterium]|nr:D-2-hydroxyacid dehydrogenase [Chloroflexota bacterium]
MKLVVTVPWSDEQLNRVGSAFPQVEFCVARTDAEALEAVKDAEIVFGDVSREVFLAAAHLRWIQCHGAGVNKLVSTPELVASEVCVTNTRGAHAVTIAEHFFGMLISLTRQFHPLHLAQQRKEWVNWSQWSQRVGASPISLQHLTLGILGFGNIGRAIASRAHAFQMEIVTADKFDTPRPDYVSAFWPMEDLSAFLGRSDVVVVTVPGTPETHHLLGYDQLSLLRPTAYLCVVSRGGIVDEAALATLLEEGRLAGAALDVAEAEPLPPTSRLWDAPNLIITPHCAGKSEASTCAATDILSENIAHYLAGRPLVNVVDKMLGF